MTEKDATRRIPRSIAAVLLVVQAGCASVERNPNVVSAYSDKLSLYNYKEEGTLVRLVVGVDGARFIRSEHYFPLFTQVANKSKITFLVTRESFTLEDPLGNQYSIVPSRELAEGYPRLDYDRRLFRDNRQFTLSGVDLFNYIQSSFYPAPSTRSLLVDSVSLPPRTFMEAALCVM